ncbi:unnamed protein product [Moneuplotes crassus]|uniref:FCP1 homology domain-containing protein n=1 Tax=Euplotes crassus TaxID=5936 RepID=A0AAD1XDC4_EUPCR|nr:unnamed protein product [Moneuplotes crassus]
MYLNQTIISPSELKRNKQKRYLEETDYKWAGIDGFDIEVNLDDYPPKGTTDDETNLTNSVNFEDIQEDDQNNDDYDFYTQRRDYWLEDKIDNDISTHIYFLTVMSKLKEQEKEYKDRYLCDPENEFIYGMKEQKKMTLVLDLDETLICAKQTPLEWYDHIVEVENSNSDKQKYYVSFRPYLFEFLEKMSKIYEIVIWTAANRQYGEQMLNLIDPTRDFISYSLFRGSCLNFQNCFIKDLSYLNRPLSHTLILDNSFISFSGNLSNAMPILDYCGDKHDVELKYVAKDLEDIYNKVANSLNPMNHDVRKVLRKMYLLEQRVREFVFLNPRKVIFQ